MNTQALRILLVDDDEQEYLLTGALFARIEDCHHHLDWTPSYDDALRAMLSGKYDAYLVDYRLGVRDGLELCREALAGGCSSPLIILTGRSDRQVDQAALEVGVADFLVKSSLTATAIERSIRYAIERARNLEQIRQQAALLDNAREAIFVRDLEGRITSWNHGAERLYGWTAAEAIGRRADELLSSSVASGSVASGSATGSSKLSDHDDARIPTLGGAAASRTGRRLAIPEQTALESGQWAGELLHVAKDGRPLEVESHWTLMKRHDRPWQVLVIDIDVTERKRLEAQFLRSQRLESVGRLASGVAHDLNNVLGGIMISLECLADEHLLGRDERRELVQSLYSSVERGAGIVRQVLTFARGTDGERLPVHLGPLVNELTHVLERTLPRSIEIRTDIASDLWSLTGDPTQLYQVLMNLCLNASDAMPDGGRLTIACDNLLVDEMYSRQQLDARPGGYVRLTVEDTGVGICREVLDKIFDPFFSTKAPGKGTGLGLSTVLGIVKNHGGFLSVQSEPGAGTKFMLKFPAAEPSFVAPPDDLFAPLERPQSERLERAAGQLVLVIDDEPIFRDVTRRTLEQHGFQAITARDGAEGLELFLRRQLEIRAVITDTTMPRLGGAATVREIRIRNPRVPIIATSGLAYAAAPEGSPSAAGRHADPLATIVQARLQKPFTSATLLRTLREILIASPSTLFTK